MLNHILFNMISETIKDKLKDVDNYHDRMKIVKKCSEELAKITSEIESEHWTDFYKTRFFKRLNDGFPVADLHTNTTSYPYGFYHFLNKSSKECRDELSELMETFCIKHYSKTRSRGDTHTYYTIEFGHYVIIIDYEYCNIRADEKFYIEFNYDRYIMFGDYDSELDKNIIDEAISDLELNHVSRHEFLDFIVCLTDANYIVYYCHGVPKN